MRPFWSKRKGARGNLILSEGVGSGEGLGKGVLREMGWKQLIDLAYKENS